MEKKVGSEIEKVMGGKDGKTPTTQDIGNKAAEGIKDLFGGKKDDKKK